MNEGISDKKALRKNGSIKLLEDSMDEQFYSDNISTAKKLPII